MNNPQGFEERKQQAKELYTKERELYNPYFKERITLNADGFHHLQFSARRERDKSAQLLKFKLLPLAISVIKASGTLQEYRELLGASGATSSRGETPLKRIEYWAFVAIVGAARIKIRVILRKVGNGNIHFWSVMPDSKMKYGKQRLHNGGIEDE
jgi:hypothetical protein